MAEQSIHPYILAHIRLNADVIARYLFLDDSGNPITNGTQLHERLRPLLAAIPDIDANDGRWRLSTLVRDLNSNPGNLDERDINNLRRLTEEFLKDETLSPELLELVAQLHIFKTLGADAVIPVGETAIEHINTVGMREFFQYLVHGDSPSQPKPHWSNVPAYQLENPTLMPTEDDAFMQALSAVITQIQTDMRTMGVNQPPPTATNGFFSDETFYEPSRLLQFIDHAMQPLGDSTELQAIRAIEDIEERIEAYSAYIAASPLSNSARQALLETLDKFGPDQSFETHITAARALGLVDDLTYSRALLRTISDVGNDRSGTLGEETMRYLPYYLAYIRENPGAVSPEMQTRAREFSGLFLSLYQDERISDPLRQSLEAELEARSGEPPGAMPPPAEAPDPTDQPPIDRTRPEFIESMQVLARMAATNGIPVAIPTNINNPLSLNGVESAHFNEAYQRGMRDVFNRNIDRIFGAPDSAPGYVTDAESALQYFLFDSENRAYEFREQPDGTSALFRIEQNGTSTQIPQSETPLLTAYRLNEDGSISGFLRDRDGKLYEYDDNLRPMLLPEDRFNFDVAHPNEVTQQLLRRLAEREWSEFAERFDGYTTLTAMPAASEIPDHMQDLSEQLRERIRQYYEDRGLTLTDEETNAIYSDLRSGQYSQSDLMRKLNTQTPQENAAATEMFMFLSQMQALNDLQQTLALRDYTNFARDGQLPSGTQLTAAPRFNFEWQIDWNSGVFSWQNEREFRVLGPEITAAYYDGTTVTTDMFTDPYAQSYIAMNGWSGEMDYLQVAQTARALMLKQSADRHGIDDPNSDEARAAFLEDYRNGHYHLHDIDIFLQAFDVDENNRVRVRSEHDRNSYAPGALNDTADLRHRSQLFNEAFGQPREVLQADGTTRTVSSTLTVEEATMMVMKDPVFRHRLGYDRARFDLSYEELLERHGSVISREVENMMNNSSLFMLFRWPDSGSPQADMPSIFEQRYRMRLEERRELEFKRVYGVVREAEDSPITQAEPNPLDEIIPAAAPDEEEPEQRGSLNGDADAPTTTAAALQATISEITGQDPVDDTSTIAGYTPNQNPAVLRL
ncbi:MAG: hypothetical protein ACK4VI_07515 [Alphaproteobacteria bacterium]